MLWTLKHQCFEHNSSFNHHPFNKQIFLVLFTRCLLFESQPCFQAIHNEWYPFTVIIFPISCCLSTITAFASFKILCHLKNYTSFTIRLPINTVFFLGLQMVYRVNLLSDTNKGGFSLYTGNHVGCEI